MAEQKISEIVSKEAFAQVEKLNAEMKALNIQLNETLTTLSKIANKPGPVKPEIPKLVEQSTATLKAQATVLNQLTTAEAKYQAAIANTPGSIRAMEAEMENLIRVRKQLDLTTDEGARQSKQYAQEISNLKAKIKENGDEVSNQRANIGNYKSAWEGVKGAFIAVGAAIASAAGIIRGIREVIASSEALSDRWEKTTLGLANAWGVLKTSIANLNFDNLFQKLTQAVKLGRDYAEVLDLLEDKQRGQDLAAARLKTENARLQIIVNNVGIEKSLRIDAAKQILSNEGLISAKAIQLANERKVALENELIQTKGLNREQLQGFIEFQDGSEEQLKAVDDYNNKLSERKDLLTALTIAGVSINDADNSDARRLRNLNKELGLTATNTKDLDKVLKNISPEEISQLREAYLNLEAAQGAQFENQQTISKKLARINKGLLDEGEAEIAQEEKKEKQAKKTSTRIEKESQDIRNLDDSYKALISSEEAELALKEARDKEARFAAFQAEESAFDSGTLPFLKSGLNEEEFRKFDDDERRRRELIIASAKAALQIYADFAQARYNIEKVKLDEEYAALEEQYRKKLISEQEYQKKKEQLDQKDRKIRHDKAASDKLIAIFQATINTAIGVTGALAQVNPILAALIGALGAAEIAAIAATPIPKYEKGRKGGKAEWAYVHPGEIIEANGQSITTPGKEALTFLPAGANVIPKSEVDLMRRMAFSDLSINDNKQSGYDIAKLAEQLSRDNEALRRTIKDKDTIAEVNMRGVYEGLGWDSYVNQNFRR